MKISGSSRRADASATRAPASPAKKPAAKAATDARNQDRFEPSNGGKVIRSNAKVIHGTPGNDVIIAGPGAQKIYGGGGNDIIIGGGGGDTIYGGAGNDTISGGAGGDTIHGGAGKDQITGGRGDDTLFGDTGADRLAGGIGDDHLSGGKGNDHASGGMGIDVLHGGAGNDVQSGDAGPDFIDGGAGNDTVSFQSQTGGGVRVEKDQKSTWRSTYEGVRYDGSAYGGSRAAGGSGVDGLKSNENVVGSAQNDTIDGAWRSVDGGGGQDTVDPRAKTAPAKTTSAQVGSAAVTLRRSSLTGGTSIDVAGGSGNDRLTVSRKGDTVTVTDHANDVSRAFRVKGPIDAVQLAGNDGNDRLRVAGFDSSVPVTLSGGNGNDWLHGGHGDDTLDDGAGNDVLIGGGGDDGLTNSAGRDRLYGGKGNDLLVSSSIDAGDRLDGGAGLDNVSFAQVGHDFAVRAQIGGTAQRIDAHGKAYGPTAQIAASAEDLEGTELDDVLIGDGKDNHLLGRGGADTLLGRGGNDLLEAQDGGADKRLDGGPGRDRATLDPQDVVVARNIETRRVIRG